LALRRISKKILPAEEFTCKKYSSQNQLAEMESLVAQRLFSFQLRPGDPAVMEYAVSYYKGYS